MFMPFILSFMLPFAPLQNTGPKGCDFLIFLSQIEEETLAPAETPRDRRKTKARIKVPAVIKPVEADKKDKKERDQWLVVQGTLQDSQGIRDAIAALKWQEGLSPKTVETVQNLMKKAAGM